MPPPPARPLPLPSLQLFVDKLRWLTYLVFTELLMLGQTMPGPSSTQMGFAIGVLKKGLLGGAISGGRLYCCRADPLFDRRCAGRRTAEELIPDRSLLQECPSRARDS